MTEAERRYTEIAGRNRCRKAHIALRCFRSNPGQGQVRPYMKILSEKVPCIRANGCSVTHVRTPREHSDGVMRIGWRSEDFDPSGQGENRARAVKKGNQNRRA